MRDKLKDPKKEKCLADALAAYETALGKEPIEEIHNALDNQLEDIPADQLATELQAFADRKVINRERQLKARKLQKIIQAEAIADIRKSVQNAADAGMKNPISDGIGATIHGVVKQFPGSRDSVDLAMDTARKHALNNLLGSLTDQEFLIWRSGESQTELVDSIIREQKGEHVDTPIGAIARKVVKLKDRIGRAFRSLGVDIHDLEDRSIANIHDPIKMMRLTRSERQTLAGKSESEIYNYTYNRWKDFIMPLLDIDRVLKPFDIDPNDTKRVDSFMRSAYDNLVNKGKASQVNLNLAERVKASRRLHWNNAADFVSYNDRFGSGAVQDSLQNEIVTGFGQIEMLKRFGVEPAQTLRQAMNVIDKDPQFRDRFGKGKDFDKFANRLAGFMNRPQDFQTTVGKVISNLRLFQVITKLGLVTIRSLSDLGILADNIRSLGGNPFESQATAVRFMTKGMTSDEMNAFADFMDVGRRTHIGKLSESIMPGEEPTNRFLKKASSFMMKANGLERWDYGTRSSVGAMLAKHFAQIRNMPWESLSDNDQRIFASYNINESKWNAIRQSQVKVARGEELITPDSIHTVSDDLIEQSMRADGIDRINAQTKQKYRDNIDMAMRRYFSDRQDHVIIRADAFDRYLLGGDVKNAPIAAALKIMSTFKSWSVGFTRKVIGTKLYAKGAGSLGEALIGPRSNLHGLAVLTLRLMGWSYASMVARNAAMGLSPPDITKPEVFLNVLTDNFGIMGSVMNIDPQDLRGSLTRMLAGPILTDADKVSRFAYDAATEPFSNKPSNGTQLAFYNMMNGAGGAVKTPLTAWLANYFIFDAWKNAVAPGRAQQDLHKLKQKTGAHPFLGD